MSLLRSLLSLVVVLCAAPLCAAEWPCPLDSAIAPCVCIADSYDLIMDCSDVTSTDRLEEVFQTHFAFSDFKRLIINPTFPSNSLVILTDGIFGSVNFEEIDITNTFIQTVEEEVLVNSHITLWRLNMGGNEINSFPFETLDLFTKLLELDLSYNKLSGPMKDIETEGLISLDLSGNTGLTLTQTAFTGTPYLEQLRLNNMGLGDTTPPNVFLPLTYLRTLYLENNGISGTLIEDFINPELKPLTSVYLDGNSLSQIHPLSVTGMEAEGTISFRNNLIVYLYREDWEGLVSQLSNANAIDLRDNPLVCGCDLVWLVLDADLMAIFHAETKCDGGAYMVDLPIDWFHEHCS
ncbi:oplophorus-luciferin 2-monooxygenase non-catalytic subunit-like [Eriocheir sinensis]|uniref:oplophorus-luciferin 2-monooxygenase non-catalytic subunit-like n=1 Tax=Eriocheir sinensis TaxID=95602 RepID=UPI0021CA6169|nr:oplophorus-luciferin 2-monooxygenase non-catalytic subunit-like [Eriocheir sinensis]